MNKLPEAVVEGWKNREGAVVLTTVDGNGKPNTIYATCVEMYQDAQIVVADNYFDKTRKNIKSGSRGSVLFITKEGKAYQVKGTLDYETEGPVFDFMKSWNSEKHPGHAAVALQPEEVYSGSEKLA